MTENKRTEARNQREERDRRSRMFWYYSGYIDALERNHIDSAAFKDAAKEYGLESPC